MKTLTTINNYEELFLQNVPLLDVRAPVEFGKGAFPCAKNHPITNDDERHLIGTYFKKHGREKAIEYGNKLISGEIKKQRLGAWGKFIKKYPNGALYCFRGGLRSHIAQRWIYEEFGVDYPLIEGGYKALRNFLITELENVGDWINPVRIGGRTGVGKTKLLLKLENGLDNFVIIPKSAIQTHSEKGRTQTRGCQFFYNHKITKVIDLEGIANHRGSSFGKKVHAQPAQIDFENNLAVELLKRKKTGIRKIFLEDEGRSIGRVTIPQKIYEAFRSGPLVILDISIKERVDLTFDEYITTALFDYQQEYGKEKGFGKWRENIETSLENIQKRLGGVRYLELKTILDQVMETQQKTGNGEGHKAWIEVLLKDYYDPMYDYHVAKLDNKIIFKGNEKEVLFFLERSQK